MRLIALLFILITPSWSVAQKLNSLKFSDINPIKISIVDNTDDGCWTNQDEMKNFAALGLELSGGKLIESVDEYMDDKASFFVIRVNALQHPRYNLCFGSIRITFEGWAVAMQNHATRGTLDFSNYFLTVSETTNIDYAVMRAIDAAIAEWRPKRK